MTSLLLLLPVLVTGLLENGGFHCKMRETMRLDRRLHGQPQTTRPPFELSILGENGQPATEYRIGRMYQVRLVGYVHYRGLLIEPRLCTPDGHLIGSLRGGNFVEDEAWDEYGIDFQECNYYKVNDSLTHKNDDKKFLVEANWTTEVDVGAVQFMATIASDDQLYWERWRPRSAFLRPVYQRGRPVNDSLFSIETFVEKKVTPAEEKEALENLGGLPFTSNPFDPTDDSESKPKSSESLEELSSGPNIPLGKIPGPPGSKAVGDELVLAGAIGRVFKKFSPEPGLSSEDLRLLNAHTAIQKDFITEMDPEEICHHIKPCANGGQCVVAKDKYSCECTMGWAGQNCTDTDWCLANNCANNAQCQNNEKATGYECKCPEGFVGTYCQFECIKDLCKNNGTCVIKKSGQLGCECPAGWGGNKCEREINECNWKKCKNGAKCTDLFNDYKCECSKGWMGKNCDRPCQDVYKSCNLWKREGQCDLIQPHSTFFDYNCAASCGKCESDQTTIKTVKPLAPILMPFYWLLGEWTAHVKGFRNRTMDYPFDMVNCLSYNETITFAVAEVLVFGTPSVNYTSKAFCESDPNNVHESRGFLTIRQYAPAGDKDVIASLSTVDNHGVTMIEEGELHAVKASMGNFLNLSPNYKVLLSDSEEKFADELTRSFTRKGNRLMQLFTKITNGRPLKFSKTYSQSKSFDYL